MTTVASDGGLRARLEELAAAWKNSPNERVESCGDELEDALVRAVPPKPDEILAVLVRDLRETFEGWDAIDVDDRNALTSKWRKLLAAVPRPAPVWQPIDVIPEALKDGSRFLGGYHHAVYGWLWDGARFHSEDRYGSRELYAVMDSGGTPTYFLPLPSAPGEGQ